MNTWYEGLIRPPLSPPNWIFGPVWTILYIMIAVSIILYFRAPDREHTIVAQIVLLIHIVTNLSWTFLFFRFQSLVLALIDLLVLDLTLLLLIFLFWKASVAAAALLVPYLFWVSFATYLNAGFYWLNRG